MGRRVAAGEDRRNPINSRIRDSLRLRLEDAAKQSDRTLSHEIEERLERSFRDDDIYSALIGKRKNVDLIKMVSTIALLTRNRKGEDWTQNSEVCNIVAEALRILTLAGFKDETAFDLSYEIKDNEQQTKKVSAVRATASAVASSAAVIHRAENDREFGEGRDLDPAWPMQNHEEEKDKDLRRFELMFCWGRE